MNKYLNMIWCPPFCSSARGTALVRTAVAVAALTGLAACSSLQSYERPAMAMPQAWTAAAVSTPSGATAADLPWQDFVRDPALRSVIAQALTHNHDLRVAVLQIEQARAQYQIREADRLPTVNLGVTGSRQTKGEGQAIQSTYTSGLMVSSWEVDLFGRLAGLQEAARAQFLATESTRKAVQMSLVAAVSNAWLSLQASDALLQLAQQTLSSREEGLRLSRLRYDNGAASALDLRSAESLTASARVTLQQQQRQRQLDANALALLVGQPLDRPLQEWPVLSNADGSPLADVLATAPVGMPSQVLLQRPDVIAAEQQLAAAQAQIGAARAAFFPRIALTTSLGSASTELSGLFRSGAWGWTLAPQALLPIFDAGRNQANLDVAKVGREVALTQYDKSIQTAFREVNDALAGRQTLEAQWQAQQELVQTERERLRLSELRLKQGVASQLEVLDAQRSLFTAQQALVQTGLAVAQNKVALYKALGGGWSVSPS